MALPNEPLTRTEQYLNRTATGGGTIPDEPLTRAEQYLNKIATGSGDTPEQPLTRMEQYLDYIAENGGGGGGSSVTVEPLTVTSNGTQTAPSGKAYSPVMVNVPNSYTDSDIGKVVASALVLVDQSYASLPIIENGEKDTTYIKRVIVNVQPSLVYSVDGALSNPFSGLDFDELYTRINHFNVFGFLWFEFNGMPVQVELYARNNIIGGTAFKTDPAVVGVECGWGANGVVTLNALMNGQVQDMRAYAPQLEAHVYLYGTTAPTPAD